ncbi:putative tripeptidyl-peptidase II [Dioscorea sansibarensis]
MQQKRAANLCLANSLDPEKVKGKIVVCLRGESERTAQGLVVQKAGGAGMILANDIEDADDIVGDAHFVPTINIVYSDGVELYSYLNSTKSPKGYILCGRPKFGKRPAPIMAPFSSLGPNPDITAPGVNVLAAFSEAATLLRWTLTLAGLLSPSCLAHQCLPSYWWCCGLLKTLNPSWSPAMIKSAIMTTDPGLVYDITPKDYFNFLGSLGYNKTMMGVFSGEVSCPSKPIKAEDLNYPSISIAPLVGTMTVTRTVKNVGLPSKYNVTILAPKGVSVTVEPAELEFEEFGGEKQFQVTMEANEAEPVKGFTFGSLEWSDGIHHVRSPLVVYI